MLLNVGKSIVEGLWSGISSMVSWVADKVKGFAKGIVDGIKGFLGIHSPSTVFAEIGDNMALGIGKGFGDSMKSVTEDIKGAIPTNLDGPEIDVPNPNVENHNLLGNGEAAAYTIKHANIPGANTDDVSYRVNPIIEDIKTPIVPDLAYQVSPLVEDFNPYGYELGDDDDGDGGGTHSPDIGVDSGNPPEVNFSPTVTFEITVQGNADSEALEKLRTRLMMEFEAKMRELYAEFREEELQKSALKNQYVF